MLKDKKLRFRKNVIFCVFYCLFCLFFPFLLQINKTCLAMPFYDLQPQELVLRAEFFTSYSTSSPERKHNIMLASKSLNNLLVAPHEEFSFNKTVGARTEKRGYKTAKIIVNGEFADGIGGGVCQVSTTLYNALLLAGMKILEFHPHSLAVSYVSPSFDAMVNSGWADLKFINTTHNPVLIKTFTDDASIRIQIFGQPMDVKYIRKSVVTQDIPAPDYEKVVDDKGEFPDLYEGENRIIKYSKAGLESEGYLITSKDGKVIKVRKIRSDKYAPIRGKIILGTAIKPNLEQAEILPTIECLSMLKEKIYIC